MATAKKFNVRHGLSAGTGTELKDVIDSVGKVIDVGSLADLTTSAKTNAVAAINELQDEIDTLGLIRETSEPNGIPNRAQSVISFDNSTRTFTIAPSPGTTSFAVWTKAVKRTYTSAQSVSIGASPATGLYYIYFDSSGVLSYRTTYFDWENDAMVAYVYWNATTNSAPFIADERHGIVLDWQTHEYLHRTRGAVIANGFSISNYTDTGTGANNSDAQFDLSGGTFFDEDLEVVITHSNAPPANTWQQDLQGPSRIPVFYQSGNGWVLDAPTDYALKQGTARIKYNSFDGSTWSTPDVPTDTRYTTSWIIGTNNINYPVIAIMGQSQANKLSDEEALTFGDLLLDGFPVVEFRPLWKIIWQTDSTYANTPNARIAGVYDIRQLSSGGGISGTTPVSDHGLLTGLGDDDHLQYLHVTETRTGVTAEFNTTGKITTTNKIGIGTTNPLDTLDIRVPTAIGRFEATGGSTPAFQSYRNSGGSLFVGVDNNTGSNFASLPYSATIWHTGARSLVFGTNNTTRGVIDSNGNVGIGITNPATKIHVEGGSYFSSTMSIGTAIDIVPYNSLNNGTLSFEGSAGQLFSITNNLTSGSIFSVNDVSGLPSIDVDADGTISMAVFDGNVGIGTDSPSQKLHVSGGNIQIGQSTTPSLNLEPIGVVGNANISFNGNVFNLVSNSSSARLDLGTSSTPRVSILSTGLVGIGTNTPDALLNVYSTQQARIVVEGGGTSTASASLVLKSNDAGSNWRATGVFYYDSTSQTEWFSGRPYSSSDAFAIHRKTNLGGSTGNATAHPDNSLFLINSSGNVGIGTTNPVQKLDVRGNIYNVSPNWIGYSDYTNLKFSDNFVELRATSTSVNGVSLLVDGSTKDLFARVFTSGTYVNHKIWHAGNDGVGSALDADLLDGQHGSYYLDTSASTQTKSGGLNVSGSVGIGTTTLGGYKLEVYDTVPTIGKGLRVNTVGASSIAIFETLYGVSTTHIQISAGNGREPQVGFSGDNAFAIGVRGTSLEICDNETLGANQRLVIDSSGNVGIGTTNPSLKFHVLGSNTVARVGSSTSYVDLQLSNSVSSQAFIQYNNTTLNFFAGSGSSPTLSITGGSPGNVGIGITNPGSKLAVNGYITESTDNGANYWNVVTQQDVGTSPNQVPLNQYLGQLAFLDDFSPNGLRPEGASTDSVIVSSNGVTTFYSTSDHQIVLNGNGTSGAGIRFVDVNGYDNFWFNGQHGTFSLGGGGSNVAGKKLHVDGGVSIGSTSDSTTTPTDGLYVQGNIQTAGALHGPANFVIDPAAIGDDTGTVEIKGNLTVQGTTTTINSTTVDLDHISLGDNEVANFGDGDDLRIYHDGNDSYITDLGTGNLHVNTNGSSIRFISDGSTTNGKIADFNKDGSVNLYYDNSLKFQTTNTGTLISGEGVFTQTTASPINDSLQIGFNSPNGFIKSKNSAASPASNLDFYSTDTSGNTNLGVRLQYTGNVGIGTDNPSDGDMSLNAPRLHVLNNITSNGSYDLVARFQSGGDNNYTGGSILINHVNNRGLLLEGGRGLDNTAIAHLGLVDNTGVNSRVITLYNNNVGIGTTNPTNKISVGTASSAGISIDWSGQGGPYAVATLHANMQTGEVKVGAVNTAGTHYLTLYSNNSEAARITSTGNVGIGTTDPGSKLQVWNGQAQINARDKANTGTTLTLSTTDSSNRMELLFGHAANNYWRIQAVEQNVAYRPLVLQNDGGNVGIGITNPAYKLEVNGSFAATTKSFVIDHPTKEGYKLRYGSLEGPENGVYVRGRSNDSMIELPEYWVKLIDENSITVNLTPFGKPGSIWVERIEGNKIYVGREADSLEYFYMVLAERADVDKLEVEVADS